MGGHDSDTKFPRTQALNIRCSKPAIYGPNAP